MYARLLRHSGKCLKYNFEAGYCLLNGAIHWSGATYSVLFVLESLLLYSAIGLFIYQYVEERWWGFSCLMIFGMRTFFTALNISRQYIAVACACLRSCCTNGNAGARAGFGAACHDLPYHIHRGTASPFREMVGAIRALRTAVHSGCRRNFLIQFFDCGGIIVWVAVHSNTVTTSMTR